MRNDYVFEDDDTVNVKGIYGMRWAEGCYENVSK